MVVMEGFSPPTVRQSSAALAGVGYKPKALYVELHDQNGAEDGIRTHKTTFLRRGCLPVTSPRRRLGGICTHRWESPPPTGLSRRCLLVTITSRKVAPAEIASASNR